MKRGIFMRKSPLGLLAISISLITQLFGCANNDQRSETSTSINIAERTIAESDGVVENSIEEMETLKEIEKELEMVFGKTPTIDYSNDRNANIFIERFNELYPDDIITEDMVSCPDNSGIYLTIIKFEYMDFCISEADGDSSYRCESILEYNDENTKGFFEEAFCAIRVSEKQLSDEAINQLLLELQDGEYPYNNYSSPESSSRRFNFSAPDHNRKQSRNKEKQLTYNLCWNHASY